MAKLLKDVLKGVKSSSKVTNDLGGYKPKAGDEENFAKKHEIEKHADRSGNGDDVFNATNVKHSLAKPEEKRHGYKKPQDAKVNEDFKKKAEDVKCNMSESGKWCPVHEMADCTNTKPLKEKNVSEAWIVKHADGKTTQHDSPRDALKASRNSPGSKVSATHGAMGQKAADVLGHHAKADIGSFGPWGYKPPEKKKAKAVKEETLDEISAKTALKTAVKRQASAHGAAIERGDELNDKEQHKVNRSQALIKNKYGQRGANIVDKAVGKKIGYHDEEFQIDEAGRVLPDLSKPESKGQHSKDYLARVQKQKDKRAEKKTAASEYLKMKGSLAKEEAIDEVLTKSTPAGKWIKDFVDSDNPKFAGKSKEKRKEMALAAYYSKQREQKEEVEQIDEMPSQHRSAAGSGRNTNRNLSALARKLSMEKPRYYRPHDVPSKADQRSEKDKAVATYTGKITKLKPGKAKGIKEDLAVPLLQGDSEGVEMVKAELKALANKAMHLVMQMPESMHVEPWCQAKIAQAKSMVSDVHDYMIYGDHKKPEEDEQTDTPMTFPNMSVDVNTGRNV